jgi:uncharacterized membrane protein
MRTAKTVVAGVFLGVALMGGNAMGQTTTTNSAGSTSTSPVTTAKGKVPIPSDLQGLVKKFETERNAYLAQQKALEAKLQDATTPAERMAIRALLQENRDQFIADLKEYRQDLKQEITELKDKLNNAELNRLIEEVRQAAGNNGHHGKI